MWFYRSDRTELCSVHDRVFLLLTGRVGVRIMSKKIRQAVGKANRRHQVKAICKLFTCLMQE